VLLVALTGGIGSGKSTVASAFAARGATVIEADPIGRAILEPGGAAYGPVIERFGRGVVREDGSIDRAAVAAIVFNDAAALADLNAISHPAIGREMAARAAVADEAGAQIVVLDLALLEIASPDLFHLDAIVVVDVPEDVAVARLVAERGFTEDDARARVGSQLTRGERLAQADYVIDNSGDRSDFGFQVDRAWDWLVDRAEANRP
jgi:dephospho-CoA kinase